MISQIKDVGAQRAPKIAPLGRWSGRTAHLTWTDFPGIPLAVKGVAPLCGATRPASLAPTKHCAGDALFASMFAAESSACFGRVRACAIRGARGRRDAVGVAHISLGRNRGGINAAQAQAVGPALGASGRGPRRQHGRGTASAAAPVEGESDRSARDRGANAGPKPTARTCPPMRVGPASRGWRHARWYRLPGPKLLGAHLRADTHGAHTYA